MMAFVPVYVDRHHARVRERETLAVDARFAHTCARHELQCETQVCIMLHLIVRERYRLIYSAYRQILICCKRFTHIYNKNRASFPLVTELEATTSLIKMSAVRHDPKPVPFTSHARNLTRSPDIYINPYPTAFPYGNCMVLHFYQQQESSTTKTVHKVINKRLKTYV